MSQTDTDTSNLPAFVERYLDEIATREHFISYTYTHEAGARPGDSFMAIVRSVKLSGPRRDPQTGVVDAAGTLSLMFKLLPGSIARQTVFSSKSVFEREVYFYATLRPYLERFQREHGLSSETGFFVYPHCFVAVADAATNEYLIAMRDLRQSGYELWDKVKPMAYENVKLVFEQLGRWHGLSFALRENRPEVFTEFTQQLEDIMLPLMIGMQPLPDRSYDLAVNLLAAEEHQDAYRSVRTDWQTMLRECVEVKDSFAVVCHGDCWNSNSMFVNATNISLLDWQMCRLASPAIDIAYFLFSSTDKALRQQHLDELLRIYHENLGNILRAFGSDVENVFPFAELKNQLIQFGRYGVVMAPILLQTVVSSVDTIADIEELAAELNKPKAEQQPVNLVQFDPESVKKFATRLGDVIDDAKLYGWL